VSYFKSYPVSYLSFSNFSKTTICYLLVVSMLFCLQISNIYNSHDFVDITEYDLYLSQSIYPDSDSNDIIDYFGNFSLEFELDGYSAQYDESAKLTQLAYIPGFICTKFFTPHSSPIETTLFTSITISHSPSTPPPV